MESSATSEVARSLPWVVVGAIGTGLFGLGLAVGGYGAYVSVLIERGLSPGAAGFGMSLFLLGQLVVVIPADRLTRRLSVERVAAGGFLLAGVGIALGSSPTLEATYASRLLLGLGQGAAFVAGMKYVGLRTDGADTATAQGILGALFTLGLALGLAIGSPAVDAFGTTPPAFAAATFAVVGAAVTSRLPTATDPTRAAFRSYLDPFTDAAGLALGLANMATFGFLIVASTWYVEVLAGTVLPGAAVLVGFAVATVAGRGLGGWLSRAVGEQSTVSISLVGLAAVLFGLAGAIGADSAPGIALGLVLTGFGFGIPFGPLFSLAFSELADDAGVTLSGMLVVGNAGALAYPWLVGWLFAATTGYAAGVATMALSVGLIWLFWARSVGV